MHNAIVLLICVIACLLIGVGHPLARRFTGLTERQLPYLRLDNLTMFPMF